jgi:hypothetical protein
MILTFDGYSAMACFGSEGDPIQGLGQIMANEATNARKIWGHTRGIKEMRWLRELECFRVGRQTYE